MFNGALSAIVTPFRDGEVDERALRDHIEWQIQCGIDGIVPCGSTGESATLTHAEHERVIKIAIEQTRRRVPVVAGTGSNCHRRGDSAHDRGARDGRRRRAADLALLQQAHPGRDFPPLQDDRRARSTCR